MSYYGVMPAKDRYHEAVRHALEADGWTITADPLHIKLGERDLFVDLGAERLIAAERGSEKIAVEVKALEGASQMASLEQALGQFVLYSDALSLTNPDRTLYMAVPRHARALMKEQIGQMLIDNGRLRLLVCDMKKEKVLQWLPERS